MEEKIKELENRIAVLEEQVQEQLIEKEKALDYLATSFSESNHNSQLTKHDNSQVD
ncbi:MAG: hypothetical protein A370_02083 [Clostridium sp. Maddingley MBC34-26]|nr:MAG: hypothetical protein A370_02083 [Clostridium sp. Maddingley MBC34-26]